MKPLAVNADMKAKYNALVAAGKPPEFAIPAVMRKLAILANALLKAIRNWTPKPDCLQRMLHFFGASPDWN